MNVHFSSKTEEWETPQAFFDELDKEFHFDIDVCATSENTKVKNSYWSKAKDGLKQDWDGLNCWMNPPYNDLKTWIEKAYNEAKKGAFVVALIPARTDTEAFHKYILPFSGLNSSNPIHAWAAGIVDGEGCIRIDKGNPTVANRLANPTYALCVSVKMTDFATVEKLRDLFGGSITDEIREKGRPLKRWEVRGELAKKTLELIYPYLVTKQLQAQKGIEFQINKQYKKGRLVSQEYLEAQEFAYKEISEIKKDQSIPGLRTTIRFIKGRLKFGDSKNSAPFPSMIVIFNNP